MITHSHYPDSPPLITPAMTLTEHLDKAQQHPLRTVILTFSQGLFSDLIEKGEIVPLAGLFLGNASYKAPVCLVPGTKIGVVLSGIGAPAAVGLAEEVSALFHPQQLIAFGSCGVLRPLPSGGLIVPTAAYRGEGTSYAYAPPADYIPIPAGEHLAARLTRWGVPAVTGGVWTTDAFYRETQAECALRLQEGCIAVDMETSALQAFCDERGLTFWPLLYGADSLAEGWERRILGSKETDARRVTFRLCLRLAQELGETPLFYGSAIAPEAALALYHTLKPLWSAATCAPRMRANWCPENPTLGQCSITAFLVQDVLGGEVYGIPLPEGGFHCFNAVAGRFFDLTSEQFQGEPLRYSRRYPQSREVHFAKAEKFARYQLLKSRYEAATR